MFGKVKFMCRVIGAVLCTPLLLHGEELIEYEASVTASEASGNFAPFYISSLRQGTLTQRYNTLLGLRVRHEMDSTQRFSWSYGVAAMGGFSSKLPYDRFIPDGETGGEWTTRDCRPASIWLQELYGSVKYRSLQLLVGMKERGSDWLDNELTSGDLMQSGNARPVPQVRGGFIDFQDIPLTNGWVQITGSIAYGKFFQDSWLRDHYNHYNSHITTGQLYTYKDIFLRSNPQKPLSVMIGAQIAGLFGGTTTVYKNGRVSSVTHNGETLKDFWNMFIPTEGSGDMFYEGQTLGSWNFMARYRFQSGHQLKGYFQWLWEDGSSMGRCNKWDGLWGVEYDAPAPWWIDGAVVEYIDFRDMSGPIHWAPGLNAGTTVTGEATGGDDYYNNYFYNSYANLGMAMGTPMAMSPIYNTDGYPQFLLNRFHGFHVGVKGRLAKGLRYRVKAGYRRAFGTPLLPLPKPVHSTMALIEGVYSLPEVPGLDITAQIGLDRGEMPGNSFGALVCVRYSGLFNTLIKKK